MTEAADMELELEVRRRVEERTRALAEVNAGLLREIERRRSEEQALREREREAELIMNNIPNLVSLLNADGSPCHINRQILEYTGKTEAELRDWGATDLVHADDNEAAIAASRAGIASGESYEITYRMRRFDGGYRWFHSRHRPMKDGEGRIFRWCVSVNDIDDRVRAEEALRDSDRKSRSMLDGIPGFVATLGPHGDVEAVGPQIVAYTGQSLAELKNWGTNGTVHPDDMPHVAEIFGASIAAGTPYEIEQRLRRHDGCYRMFSNRGTPSRDAEGVLVGWYVLLVDVEERWKAEATLEQLRSELTRISRISSLGVLTASVAHEVSQPLSGIISNASTCLRMLAADPPNVGGAIETTRRTMRDGNRASEVVARLRALFSKKTYRTDAVDLNEAVAEVVALAAPDLKGNRVVVRMDCDDLPSLTADRVQLQQVIMNLLLNASDAMRGVNDRPRTILIRTWQEDGGVTLSVRDDGIGFPPEDAEKLFETFYTTKSNGMGIGLSVSRAIVESHLGRLWCKPNDGSGATFSLHIPLAPATSDARFGAQWA